MLNPTIPDHVYCTCTWEDDGDGESGPHLSCTNCDEACPHHGRKAVPHEWVDIDRMDIGETVWEIGLKYVRSAWYQPVAAGFHCWPLGGPVRYDLFANPYGDQYAMRTVVDGSFRPVWLDWEDDTLIGAPHHGDDDLLFGYELPWLARFER